MIRHLETCGHSMICHVETKVETCENSRINLKAFKHFYCTVPRTCPETTRDILSGWLRDLLGIRLACDLPLHAPLSSLGRIFCFMGHTQKQKHLQEYESKEKDDFENFDSKSWMLSMSDSKFRCSYFGLEPGKQHGCPLVSVSTVTSTNSMLCQFQPCC